MDFDSAFDILLKHEGGYVNDLRDRGGETRYGISKSAYPHLDIQALTINDCKTIYKRDYWGPAGCDAVPDAIKYDLFDMAVHSGVITAIKTLQRTVVVEDDGELGPVTLQAVASMPPVRFVARFNGARLQFMSSLSTWPAFGRGWANRIAKNLLEA